MEENGDVEGLIQALNNDSENNRREAITALERIGDSRATEPLIQLLHDPDRTIQENAITALGRIQDKKAVHPLIQTLNNPHLGVRWKVAEALGKIGDPQATEPLIQILDDPDKTIQEEAITALGRIQDKKAVPSLIQTLSNSHLGIRCRAAEALGKIGDPQATEPLIQTLSDPEQSVEEEALTALGRIAVDPLIGDLRSGDQGIRDNAIIAFNQLRDLKIITPNKTSHEELSEELPEKKLIEEIKVEDKSKNAELKENNGKKLVKSRYNKYIKNFVKNSRYNYIEGFNRKTRYDYEFTDVLKLRELLNYRKMDFSDEEIVLLIQEEIKNQEYSEFKDNLLKQHPNNITNYLEILIKTYPDPQSKIEQLKKLLEEQKITIPKDLSKEIEKTGKQIEIKEFENKLLIKEAQTPDEKESPTILKEFRIRELKENRDFLLENRKYIYIETFVRKSRYKYEFGDIRKFRELLKYKEMKFSDDDLLWLIQEEIKNQEYTEFKEEILSKQPVNLTNYIEIFIKIYPNPQNKVEQLEKLLKEQKITTTNNLTKEIEKTVKQIEITEFENKLLSQTTQEVGLPVEMEDLDEAYISFNIGNLYYDLGKLEKALTYYDRALYIYPDFLDVWKYRGLIYFISGRLQKAAACYNHILNLDPEYPELWIDIGIIFFETGKINEAKICYEKATETNPCYQSQDLATNTCKFLENRPISLNKLKFYLELASSSSWESSDPTPPLSRIMRLIQQKEI